MMVQMKELPKLSELVIDGDLDLGGHAILTTDLALSQGTADGFAVQNRAKTAWKDLNTGSVWADVKLTTPELLERNVGGGVTIDSLKVKDAEILTQGAIDTMILEKVASATARHSHDAEAHDEATGGAGNYVLLKTITFADGLKGMLRISFSISGGSAGVETIARIYKNGIPWGTAQTAPSDSYVFKTEDVYCDLAPGDTLELKGGYSSTANWCYVKEFRVKYDNADIDVASANS